MQSSARPEFAPLLDSLQLGGTGKTVALSFDLPPALLDTLMSLGQHRQGTLAPQQ
jgi:hypothetical protein